MHSCSQATPNPSERHVPARCRRPGAHHPVRRCEPDAPTRLACGAGDRAKDPWARSPHGLTVQRMVVESGKPVDPSDPHAGETLLRHGAAPAEADAVLVLLHGRGATAESILSLGAELALPTVAMLAPQAAGHTWYPHSFLATLEANQPFLDSAL